MPTVKPNQAKEILDEIFKNPGVLYGLKEFEGINFEEVLDIREEQRKKFYRYLGDKFRISKAILFIGYIPQNKKLYWKLKSFGYKLVFKPTIKDSGGKPKGNIDAELVLYAAAIEYRHYDKAIIVSGDGDFYCLHKFLEKNKKLHKIIIPNSKSASMLLRDFQKYKVFLEFEKEKLVLRPQKNGRRRS